MAKATKAVPTPKSPVPTQPADLARLEKIFEVMSRHGIGELEWEKGGEKLKVRTAAACNSAPVAVHGSFAPPVVHHAASAPAIALPASKPVMAVADSLPAPAKPAASNQKTVTSPFVGTFYRSSSPTADPYVREGQTIKRGDVLCIIEAMKLMNEIEAEFSGKIVSILVENGQPVEFGEALFTVET